MNSADVVRTFEASLRDWQRLLAASEQCWEQLDLAPRMLREDLLTLVIDAPIDGAPGDLFDHQLEQRRLLLYPALLEAYAATWKKRSTPAPMRRLMAELFLLHEWKHVPQLIASATYRIGGESRNDFFARLDYTADAYAVNLCYGRLAANRERIDSKRLARVLEAHILNGCVFGSIESTADSDNQAVDGARIRRQLIWGIQAARAASFPPEAGYAAFGLAQPLDVQLFALRRQGMSTDICDERAVTRSAIAPPLKLLALVGQERRLDHTISDEREARRLGELLFDGTPEASAGAFRSLFAVYPELVGRGGAVAQTSLRRSVTVASPIDADIPTYRWDAGRAPAAALLRADYEVVPFHLRRRELRDFSEWSQRAEPLLIRVLTGEGGVGKTRFCRQYGKMLLASGEWTGGFVTWTPSWARPPHLSSGYLATIAMIDYSEQAPDTIRAVIEALSQREGKSRLILLARSAGSWLDTARRSKGVSGDVLRSPSTEVIRMEGVGRSANDRGATLARAEREFRRRLGSLALSDAIPSLHDDASNTLLLHASVLAGLFGTNVGAEKAVLIWLAERERRFWSDHSRLRGIPDSLERALCEIAALACASDGAADRQRAAELIRCSPLTDGQPNAMIQSIAELFHELYPGPRWLNPVQPDLVKETVLALHLSDEARTRLAAL
jgi:hypothetical protein